MGQNPCLYGIHWHANLAELENHSLNERVFLTKTSWVAPKEQDSGLTFVFLGYI